MLFYIPKFFLIFQSEISDLSPEHDNSDKLISKNLVKDIAIDIGNSKMKNGGRVPHGEFNKHLDRVNDICPTVTRSMINMDVRLHWTSLMYEDECAVVSNKDNDIHDNLNRNMKVSYVVSKFIMTLVLNMQ